MRRLQCSNFPWSPQALNSNPKNSNKLLTSAVCLQLFLLFIVQDSNFLHILTSPVLLWCSSMFSKVLVSPSSSSARPLDCLVWRSPQHDTTSYHGDLDTEPSDSLMVLWRPDLHKLLLPAMEVGGNRFLIFHRGSFLMVSLRPKASWLKLLIRLIVLILFELQVFSRRPSRPRQKIWSEIIRCDLITGIAHPHTHLKPLSAVAAGERQESSRSF